MRRFRFSIASLLVVVLFVAVGFATLRKSSDLWESGVFTLTLAALLISILLAVHRTEFRRTFWIGFALFGWIYLGLFLVPSIEQRFPEEPKHLQDKDLCVHYCKHSVNPPASVQRVPCPRPRPRLAVGSVIGIPRRNLTMRRGYDVSGAGTSSSHPHARLCSGLRFHGRNRSTSSTARPPAWAHASR